MFAEFQLRDDRTTFAAYDEAVVWDARRLPIVEIGDIFHGHAGVRQWWRSWLAAWGRIEIVDEPKHYVHGNQVVSVWAQQNVGAGSGAPVPQETGVVWTFVDGKIVHVAVFPVRADALRAVGLEPAE